VAFILFCRVVNKRASENNNDGVWDINMQCMYQ
jgi:hypothetical protein